ncbi:aspartate/glutamate racemase family protein [Lipingzhangella sp. LS1_29]|uniref:Aspartate/glutamate racemase family protein n=1 Tax=Lipingzhangella rawalii TaxID=2055835 RepID=A0ABU2H757_9ACTN|nr:aspartate/glutamate racemase family protein [Lipingzhangella rawalii]MDS1271147.1 aspartate/glutamate racemase family protein [Lipingzhangella rawalii]
MRDDQRAAPRIAIIDSGLGLLSTAAALRRARPDAHLILATDPDHMPWGPRSSDAITERARAGVQAALAAAEAPPQAVVIACNTASVYALATLRAELEPEIPVVGTVPAIKPAADLGGPVAVWATPATTGSAYQNRLIARFANGVAVTPVACPGLAPAVDTADTRSLAAAIADAAGRTPQDTSAVVLGCTHYDLVRDHIHSALPAGVTLFSAAGAVANQTLRRMGRSAQPDAPPTGSLLVLASGRRSQLSPAATTYPAGALLAANSVDAPVPNRG